MNLHDLSYLLVSYLIVNMSPVKRQIVNRLVRLACAEISQEVLKELGSKQKRKWVKGWYLIKRTNWSNVITQVPGYFVENFA